MRIYVFLLLLCCFSCQQEQQTVTLLQIDRSEYVGEIHQHTVLDTITNNVGLYSITTKSFGLPFTQESANQMTYHPKNGSPINLAGIFPFPDGSIFPEIGDTVVLHLQEPLITEHASSWHADSLSKFDRYSKELEIYQFLVSGTTTMYTDSASAVQGFLAGRADITENWEQFFAELKSSTVEDIRQTKVSITHGTQFDLSVPTLFKEPLFLLAIGIIIAIGLVSYIALRINWKSLFSKGAKIMKEHRPQKIALDEKEILPSAAADRTIDFFMRKMPKFGTFTICQFRLSNLEASRLCQLQTYEYAFGVLHDQKASLIPIYVMFANGLPMEQGIIKSLITGKEICSLSELHEHAKLELFNGSPGDSLVPIEQTNYVADMQKLENIGTQIIFAK